MSPVKDYPAEVASVAKRAGGRVGKAVRALAEVMGNPELGIRTLAPVRSQFGAVLNILGQYRPGVVPLRTKKLMRKDAQIRLTLEAFKAPLIKAPLWFESVSTEVQALCNNVFVSTGFMARALETALLAHEFGFSSHEKVWDLDTDVEVAWDVPQTDGVIARRTKTYPSLFVPKDLRALDPEYVTLVTDDYGTLQGLIYGVQGFDPLQTIDLAGKNRLKADKVFNVAFGGEWQNHYGEGTCDYAYDPWYWQSIIYLVCNRWFERKGDPPLVGTAPAAPALAAPDLDLEEGYNEEDEDDSPLLLHARGLRLLRSTGVYVHPSDPYFDDQGKPSTIPTYSVKELEVADMSDVFIKYLEHLDRRKSRAMLLPDSIVAGQSGAGTYGSLQILSDVAVDIQNARLQRVVAQLDAEVVQPFLAYNGITDRVLLRSGGVSPNNQETLKEIALKVLEADMLAEQAWGRVFPASLPQMISRDDLLRGLNIPHKQPDPDAPTPKPPDPAAGRDALSNQGNGGKTNPGGGRAPAMGVALAQAYYQGVRDAQERKVP